MKNTKAIIFDLGGVILDISYNETIKKFKEIGLTNIYTSHSQDHLFNLLETGHIQEDEFLLTLQKMTQNVSKEEIKFAWNSMILNLPDKNLKLLSLLKKKFKLFLLSNTNNIHINYFKEMIGQKKWDMFSDVFEKIYFSHKIGVRKPDFLSFQIILDENKLDPQDVFFIDDSSQHINAAKKLEIPCFHLKDNNISKLISDRFQLTHH